MTGKLPIYNTIIKKRPNNMKKISFYIFFLVLAYSSYAIDLPNRSLYIEGTAEEPEHSAFFLTSFSMEAIAMDFIVTDNKDEAGYTLNFHVQSYTDEYDPSLNYIILISLINNETDTEIVSFGWPYAELEEMYEHTQFVFNNAVIFIPGISEDDLENLIQAATVDNRWKNKWLYLRVSLDYPITFYQLQPTGLISGQGAYMGPYDSPTSVQHLDHKVIPQPGFTLGFEWQFINILSLELNFQGNLGDPETYYYFNAMAGAQLKYNFKTRYFLLQPYGAFIFPFNISPEFSKFPPLSLGAGIQAGIKGGKSGVVFIDLNCMFTPGDVYMHNPYGDLAPSPSEIHYRRFVFGLGIGYKFGFIDRIK